MAKSATRFRSHFWLTNIMPSIGIMLALCTTVSLSALASNRDIAHRYRQVEAEAMQSPRTDDMLFAQRVQQAYTTAFGSVNDANSIRRASDEDLTLHWRAVETAAFYSDSPELANTALRVYQELESRGLSDAKASQRAFNLLLKSRQFNAARAFAAQHPAAGLPVMPIFEDADLGQGPSAWRFSPDGTSAKRVPIDLEQRQIVVVAGCHFSEDAAKDIASDPLLGPLFARHARWFSLPPGSEKLDALAEWTKSHPEIPMLPIYDRAGWAPISTWVMPTFAIVEGGRVIDSAKGWRRGEPEFRAQLLDLLRRHGLLEPQPQD